MKNLTADFFLKSSRTLRSHHAHSVKKGIGVGYPKTILPAG